MKPRTLRLLEDRLVQMPSLIRTSVYFVTDRTQIDWRELVQESPECRGG